MYTIRNKQDLCFTYSFILLLQQAIENGGCDVEKTKQSVVEMKREIRDYYKRQEERQSSRLVKDYGVDGYVELVQFPETVQDEQEAKEYFEEEVRIVCSPSMYDCTGQAFTGWRKIFKRDGKYMCYHRICFDV